VKERSGVFIVCLGSVLVVCAAAVLRAQAVHASSQSGIVSSQDASNDLSVAVGKSVLVDFTEPMVRVAVGMDEIAAVTVTSPTEVMVNGKAPGQTSLIVWQKDGSRQFFNITVRRSTFESTDRLDAVRRQLMMELPGQAIKVSSENGAIFLRGTVRDLESSNRAVEIASTALGATAGADSAAKGAPGAPAPAAGGASGKVVNLLYVDVPAAEKQILLKVRFASVDRSKAKQLGINLASLGMGNTVGGISTGQFSPPTLTGATSTSVATAAFSNTLNIVAETPGNLPMSVGIQALETKGVVEVLAEPNLLAANGKQASFLAGGEYPYPVPQAGAGGSAPTITIMFKEYGVRLNFIPTITPRGSIRLQVAPEVSSLDFTNAVELSGAEVPAITTRRVKTEVELNDGQSFVIGGLLDNRETETLQKIPYLGDVPVLGRFFQSMTRSHTNTELIVVVTPELVDPIPAGAPLPSLKYPTKFLPPNSDTPMQNPDGKVAPATPVTPPPIPVEKLEDSLKPETPLVIEGGISQGSGSGSSTH
jgi:pilus assembly protein CpaC